MSATSCRNQHRNQSHIPSLKLVLGQSVKPVKLASGVLPAPLTFLLVFYWNPLPVPSSSALKFYLCFSLPSPIFKVLYELHPLNILSAEEKGNFDSHSRLMIGVFSCSWSKAVTQSKNPDNGGVAEIIHRKSMGNAVLEASHIQ